MKFKLLFKPILFRNIKQMKFKKNKFYTPILLPILAVSLMSIGFSSWYLGENYSINLDNLEVISGETKDLSDFILFNKTEETFSKPTYKLPDALNYNKKGIVNNGLVEKKGTCIFYFAIKLRGEEGLFNQAQSVNVFSLSMKITDKNNGGILNYLSSTISYVISPIDDSPSYENTSTLAENFETELSCNNSQLLLQENLFYSISFNFDFSEVSDFSTIIYPLLQNFRLSIAINKR